MEKTQVQKKTAKTSGHQKTQVTPTHTSENPTHFQEVPNRNPFGGFSAGDRLTPVQLLQLQQTHGNRAVGRLIQAKLTVGRPDDQYEREADRVADTVMRMPEPTPEEEETPVQTKPLAERITPLAQRAPQEEETVDEESMVQRIPETEEDKRVLQGPHEAFEGALEEEEPVIRRMPQVEEDEEQTIRQMPMAEEEEEESAVAMKPVIQRMPEMESEEGEEVVVAAKHDSDAQVQRQVEEEEEQGLQAKHLPDLSTRLMPKPVRLPTHSANPQIQRVCTECKAEMQRQPESEEEMVQTKPLVNQQFVARTPAIQPKGDRGSTSQVSPATAANIQSQRGGGSPLPRSARSFFEPRFAADFSQVRVHADGEAAQLSRSFNAQAFTHGQDVYFGAGKYNPDSGEGKWLLAHELTHTIQQSKQQTIGSRVMRDIDKGKYYSDKKGAVSRARKLQQHYTNVEIFQRADKNWQVRYSDPLPSIKKFPSVDPRKYYKDQAGAEARAKILRAYGFVVEIFQRPDKNWQCRITRSVSPKPGLPTSTGPDAGFYFKAESSAKTRAEALSKVGYTVEIFQRADKNWQVKINALPTFNRRKAVATKTPLPVKKPSTTTSTSKPKTTTAPTAPKKTPAPKATGGPPHKLVIVNSADPAKKKLSDAVVKSYRDFVAEVKKLTGQDLALGFGDTVRKLKDPTAKVGADTVSWHKTGRAVDINQGLRWVIEEAPKGKQMFFKLYLLHSDKKAKPKSPEVVKFPKGKKFHSSWYPQKSNSLLYKYPFVNVTAIATKHGWNPIPAQPGWKKSYNKREWWHFEKREGKTWYQSLAEIYTVKDIVAGIKMFAKGTAGANKYGARLQREGIPLSVLKQIFPKTTQGSLALRLPVGTGKHAANLTEDVEAVQNALIKVKLLGGTATGILDTKTKKAILDFQKKQLKVKKPDGRVDVGGFTHRKLGAVK